MRKDFLIFGAGKQGRFIARLLCGEGYGVGVVDVEEKNLQKLQQTCPRALPYKMNPFEEEEKVLSLMKEYKVVIDALPARIGLRALKLIIKGGRNGVSISFMGEDFLALHREAEARQVLIVPDCGVAPGLSNFFAGRGAKAVRRPVNLKIKVGGIPVRPLPPFYHNLTWSVEDMLEEYLRPARIKVNGQIREVRPLSDIKEEKDFAIPSLASFPTDGLRSLLYTLPIANMEERTLRYKAHLERMKVLEELGFFSEKTVKLFFGSFPVKHLTARILETNFSLLPVDDILLMRVEVFSPTDGIRYDLVDRYDPETGITAMTRTTGVAAYIFAKALLEGRLKGKGVLPPERFAFDDGFFAYLLRELNRHRIEIREKILG